MAGGASAENEFLYNKLNNFRVDSPDASIKPKFAFTLPGLGEVCRAAWILAVGFPNRNNSRVRMLEARIRRGQPAPSRDGRNPLVGLTNTSYVYAFLQHYILKNSQPSPVTTERFVIFMAVCILTNYSTLIVC